MVRAEPLRVAPRNAGSADKAKLELEQEVGFPFFCLYKSEEGGGVYFFIMLAEPDRKPRQPVRLKSN